MARIAVPLAVLTLLLTCLGGAHAVVVGPQWPPPGGCTWYYTGSAGDASGARLEFYSFDPSKYDQLYWGPWDTTSPGVALDGAIDEVGESSMDWAGLTWSGQRATWTGESEMAWTDSGTGERKSAVLNTKFEIVLQGATFIDGSSLGVPGGVPVVAPVTGSFWATMCASAEYQGAWWSANPLADYLHAGPGTPVQTSFSGGFYTTSSTPPTPELSTWALLASTGLFALGTLRRRRKA